MGKFDFAKKFLLEDIVVVKCWHRNVIPLFHPLLSRGNSISQSQAMDNNAITPNYETRTLFLFSKPPCDMNGFGNGTMQCGCTVHTHTIYNI